MISVVKNHVAITVAYAPISQPCIKIKEYFLI